MKVYTQKNLPKSTSAQKEQMFYIHMTRRKIEHAFYRQNKRSMRIDIAQKEQMCYNTGMAKTYKVLETKPDGHEVRLYEDGSKRDERGWLLELAPGIRDTVIRTPERAREVHEIRKRKILERIEQGVTDALKADTPYHAIAYIIATRAKVAMESDGREGNDAAKLVLQAMDAFQDKRETHTTVQRNEYVMDDETRDIIMRIVEAKRGTKEIIDGELE
jgi:hypothetical protein